MFRPPGNTTRWPDPRVPRARQTDPRRFGTTGLATVLAMVLAVILLSGSLSPLAAHIVPPEKLHPATESYRRLLFTLSLNPVPWDLVTADMAGVSPAGLSAEATDAIADGRDAESADDRRDAVRRLFSEATRTLAAQVVAALESGRGSVDDHRTASAALDLAQKLWEGFVPEVRATDPDGYRRLGASWLAMSSALGSPGVLELGAVAADRVEFETEANKVIAYIERSFDVSGEGHRPGRLAPVPSLSPTFDRSAPLPMKLPPGHDINKQLPRPRQVLNMAERGVDEGETNLIALGDMAFDSSFIFGEPARSLAISCNTCHNKSVTNPGFFIPGLSARPGGVDVSSSFFAPHANNGVFDPLDIPDLRGIRFTAPYGRNGRFASLREFTRNVIVNEFNGAEPSPLLLDGLMAYMLEFDFLPSPWLEADGRLTDAAPESAKRGEALFHREFATMGDRSCATCHVPSDHFIDRRRHDVGTVSGAGDFSRDRALDTPTLLSAKTTAPYLHDGSLPTLEAVVRYFDRHYGLGFSETEIGDLTAYVETVGDGIDAYEDTIHTLDAELEEFRFFLSTFDLLEVRDDRELIDITLRTVALELRAHKWDVRDLGYLPTLEQMAILIDEAAAANREGDHKTTRHRIEAYRDMYETAAENLR